MRILHLSDLHFGFEKDKTEEELRANYSDALCKEVLKASKENSIDYVFITGDIAWKAKAPDYDSASLFINKIIENAKVPPKNIFLCPGNHDVDRDIIQDIEYPSDQGKTKTLLKHERLDRLSEGFEEYIKFCEKFNFPKYSLRESGKPSGIFRRPSKSSEYAMSSDL